MLLQFSAKIYQKQAYHSKSVFKSVIIGIDKGGIEYEILSL